MRKFKPILIVVASFALLICIAYLATSGAKAAGKFTGCHLGLAGGYSVSNNKTSLDVPGGNLVTVDGFAGEGITGTATVGCDLQVDRFVFGAWADYNWVQDADTVISALNGAIDARTALKSSYAAGVRAGLLLNYDTYLYGLVGYSKANFDDVVLSISGTPVGSLNVPEMSGWMVGGGIEAMLPMPNTKIDLRYSATFYGRENMSLGGPLVLGFEPTVHNVRIGFSYLFSFDGMPNAPQASALLKP